MKKIWFCLILTFAFAFQACNSGPKITRFDTITSGEASVVCDDCFSPIMEEELAVFHSLYEDAKITPVYTNEVDGMNLFLKDSIRLIVAARDLSTAEFKSLESRNLSPRSCMISIDGIALIINKHNRDSLISVSELKRIISGEIVDWKSLSPDSKLGKIKMVFDNPNSSTVRFIRDSICGGKLVTNNVSAQETNQAVIDFVSKTPNALGVIGVSWVSNPKDTTHLSFIDPIRVMSVSAYDDAREDNSYQPFAAFLALNKYPLVRNVYMITSDIVGGLPSGFLQFVSGDSGQRIILKAGLVPATRPMRLISIKHGS